VRERSRVYDELNRIPYIRPYPSYANFILFRSETMPEKDLFHALYDKGVVVRIFNKPELRNCLRVTLGTKKENRFFLQKLNEVMAHSQI